MTNESPKKTLGVVRALALKDLEASSDDEIRAEFVADGIYLDDFAAKMAVTLDEVVSACLRQQAAAAKVAMRVQMVPRAAMRFTLEHIKEKIAQAFAMEPQLATAFREGTRQSDADLQSLYDDLVLMGKIASSDDER